MLSHDDRGRPLPRNDLQAINVPFNVLAETLRQTFRHRRDSVPISVKTLSSGRHQELFHLAIRR